MELPSTAKQLAKKSPKFHVYGYSQEKHPFPPPKFLHIILEIAARVL